MVVVQYNEDPCEIQKFMDTEIQRRSMRQRLKFGHSYQTYNVYLCHTDKTISIATEIQCGSMQ